MENKRFWNHENTALIILCLGWGFLFFDRLATNYLMPFILEDIALTNTHIALILAAFSFTWAVGGYIGGYLSDVFAKKKSVLIISILLFSLSSFMTGLAGGFISLLIIRMIMGAVEGPFFPAATAILTAESSDNRRGFNMGFFQNFPSNILGGVLAPIILVALAMAIGWRFTFFLTMIPGLIIAWLVWKFLREPQFSQEKQAMANTSKQKEEVRVKDLFKYRNFNLCVLIGVFMCPWYLLLFSFTPLYLTQVKGINPSMMSYVMAAVGISCAVWGFIVTALSDRIGRKAAMIIFSLVSMIGPLAIIFFNGPFWILMLLVIVGCAGPGILALYMSIIPSETVPKKYIGAAIGLTVGVGEIVGGVGIVTLSGVLADKYGLITPMLIIAGLALITAVISIFLIESAPVKLAKKQGKHPSSITPV